MTSDWDWGHNVDSGHRFDWSKSFDENVAELRSVSGGRFRRGGHNYWVLRALFAGHAINDYTTRPVDGNGRPINNVRSRISDLRENWNIVIGSRFAPDKTYKEYKLYGRPQ